jgi:uncharacterized membrane protein
VKKLLALFVSLGLFCSLSVGLVGCTKEKAKTQAEKDKEAKDKEAEKKKFAIEVSADPKDASMKPGDSKDIKIMLARGAKADKEATLTVEVDPKVGVTGTPDPMKVKDKEAKLTVKAADDAKEGDYTITITAKAEGSDTASTKIKVTVAKKEVAAVKDMKLEVTDPKGITVKQADKGTVKVSVTMGADLKKAGLKAWVKDKDNKEVAKGVTAELDYKTLEKSGDATVTVTVAGDAAPGDYMLTIETSGEGAVPASVPTKVTVKVEKK